MEYYMVIRAAVKSQAMNKASGLFCGKVATILKDGWEDLRINI